MRRDLLKKIMKKNGVGLRGLSKKTGIWWPVLFVKLVGIVEFRAKEIVAISSVLNLTGKQTEKIFFSEKVS